MISVENLKVEFNATPLFGDASFVINNRERVALVGKNGAGKSTMLKVLAGLQEPTAGHVTRPRGCTIGYLPQVMVVTDERTVMQETELAFAELFDIRADIERVNTQLAALDDCNSDNYHALVERLTHLNEQFRMLGGHSYQAEAERTLLGLGFRRSDFGRPTSEFSGGWRMRIEIAKLLLRHPDVLLLDEPTNHLDIESIQWLETFLATRANAVMIVSHDRAFLNNITTRTIEISCGRIYDYKVSYDRFVTLRRERREQQLRAYENQQKQIEDTEAFIERFRYKATKAVQVQSRIKQLEKIQRIEVDEEDRSTLRLKFTCHSPSGTYPLTCDDVAKAYGSHTVFSHVNLSIRRGEKVAFVGRNGEGKSTLVKCIIGQINDYTGRLTLGHNVLTGYFAQNQAQLLDDRLTVFDTIDRVATGDIRLRLRDLLGAFMFGGEASDKKVGVLSGGERTRLSLIKLLLEPVNFLILDEPTNHLDMRSKDVLKEAIRGFEGTAIIVSHDRDFLDGLVSKVYEFADGRVSEHIGGIYDYLRRRQVDDIEQWPGGTPTSERGTATTDDAERTPSQGRQTYEEQKERARQRKRLQQRVAELEAAIAETEAAVAILEARMTSTETTADNSIYEKHGRLRAQLERSMNEWEEASTQLELLL